MTKIVLRTTHQEVTKLVREMILTGELPKGEKINETRLSDLLGVSRTPIREALRTLHAMGLVDLFPQRGAFVTAFSAEETTDLFELMSVLEGMAARLATQKMSNADFEKIESLHQELETHYKLKNHKEYSKTNQEFHSFILSIAANKALNEAANGILEKTLLCKQKQIYLPKRFDQSILEHRNLLEAFRTRDAKKAEKMMAKHLVNQGQALVKQYSRNDTA